jgi:hydroxypyruvate isomerase
MPKFSANLGTMFTEVPFLQRIAAARKAGFLAIEGQFIHEFAVDDLKREIEAADVAVSVFNLPQGDLPSGGPGLTAMPGRETQFREAIEIARPFAAALKPVNINILPGWPPAEEDRAACRRTMIENIRNAADVFAEMGITVVIEALNTRDRPGAFLTTTEETAALIDEADHSNLAIEYDLYHMQIQEGDLIPTIERYLDNIGHIQFADTPGRHEPGTGEINFATIFDALDRLGYDRWVGAEYISSGRTEESLGWMTSYR